MPAAAGSRHSHLSPTLSSRRSSASSESAAALVSMPQRSASCGDGVCLSLSAEGAKAVVLAMKEHPDEEPVQEQSCWVLQQLAEAACLPTSASERRE